MIRYVTGFMFSDNLQNVALISKIKPAWQKGLLNGVGGKIEHSETAEEAMAREFMEETGVNTNPEDWKLYTILSRPDEYEVNFFYMRDDRVYSVRTIEKEKVDVYQSNFLPDKVIWNLRWLIPLAQDSALQFSQPLRIYEKIAGSVTTLME
ncbi:NUDIX domain-containing protein [Shewanella psychropiezotolerans]|uniref:NUDIX domain-containing protein n=1 Tax=Shewanella psychropiezotolerans TaxID=2593655 RepID=A0ABX5X2W4_9GAMM|nr:MULTISPECIES: NUDIX domain-containing protein [Shewanella]MPY21593.1 NUDIX domain-containing protein [Shewanella sp. YLB-07]QDO84802.1 NUDIX domain-containing protein [Shewanella psychropiezotolerans]